MRMRDYRSADAAVLAEILHAAVHEIGGRDYTAAQLAAWSPAPLSAESFHSRVSDGRSVFVAVSAADVPRAFIELERDGHIDCFYCHPEVAGTGVGRLLFAHLKTAAIAARIPRLYVEASEAARRFLLREGFHVIARRDFERGGVEIHNYDMELRLSHLGDGNRA